MPRVQSEYEVEIKFIERLESIGYRYLDLKDYDDVIANARTQLAAFNAKKLSEAKGSPTFSDAEWNRVMIHLDNHSVYESAKILRDKYVLTLDDGKTVYLEFFSYDTDRNIYQVSHQITMDPAHVDAATVPVPSYKGMLELRGLDPAKTYTAVEYTAAEPREFEVKGSNPKIEVAFERNYLLKLTPNN